LAGHSLLLVDWGALNQGYASDLTRVIALGPPSEKLREVHRIVHEAQAAAFAAVRSGVPRADIDRAARDVIRGHGYGDCFSHALGHGIGRQVHEVPRLAEGQTELLEAGMVITLEPGIYLPGWGGVRLEDDILVTDHGAERLSSLPLDLEAQTVIW
jgi:Xaa-Pro aminopeptidase